MNLFKGLQKAAVVSAVVFLGFTAIPSVNAAVVDTPAGTCVGDATHDCVTTTGHISASVVTTLTINETRAVSFGNMAVTGADDVTLDPDSTRSVAGANITLLHGAQANDNAGGDAGDTNSGGQSAGHYLVQTGIEGAATQVYIAFATTGGAFVDFDGDDLYGANAITLTGTGADTMTVDDFTIDCASGCATGSDVYGHYVDNAGADATGMDVLVGATLHSTGVVAPGKYSAAYNVMVSY